MTGHGSHKAGNHIEALSAPPVCVERENRGFAALDANSIRRRGDNGDPLLAASVGRSC